MFSMLILVKKQAHLSSDEFMKKWSEEYGPLYREIPQVKKYQQLYLSDRNDDPYDGAAIISFDSKEEMKAAFSTSEYEKASALREEFIAHAHITRIDSILDMV